MGGFIEQTEKRAAAMRSADNLGWRDQWRSRELRRQFYITAPALALTMFIFTRFILTIEARQGVVLPDPILALFAPRDVTWIIFTLIYGGVLLGIISLVAHPRKLLLALRAYTILVLVRMVVMYLVPLAPPEGMIALVDPFASASTGAVLARDLFFSGHTATFCILFLTAQHSRIRALFLICAIATGSLLLVQHVHYSIDVVAAPFFAYACYRIASFLK
jgi:hypothetical protein